MTTRIVLDLLASAGISATFFAVGWVAERHPALIETIAAAGHEIGSHGYLHQRAYDLGRERFAADLARSVHLLESMGAGRVRMFRAPEWSVNDHSLWALPALRAAGIDLDASMAPVKIVGSVAYPRYPHLRETEFGPIREMPPLVADRFGHVMPMGWGWGLRMSSPRRVLQTIEQVNRRGWPAVLTIHPWELDPEPPRVRLPARLHFAHYFRLTGFRERLRAVLGGAPFGRLGDVAATLP